MDPRTILKQDRAMGLIRFASFVATAWTGLAGALPSLESPAAAQVIVSSPRPERVAVTVYRAPGRHASQAIDLDWPDGYALISETRVVRLPAGESELRFVGVAGGILPQSAVVTGLPEDIVERNRDAYLLSPGTLLDRSLGRRVHLRRTSRDTGRVREHEAIFRSGAGGEVVLQTREGFETLRCTGLPETVIYEEVPPGLSPRPTLSVRARSSTPVRATVTLTYLATGFDWQADYIATLSPEGDRIELFGWLTLANGDETSFVNADTQAVAGRVNREHAAAPPSESRPLTLNCWPHSTTSDIPLEAFERMTIGSYPIRMGGEEVVVTGSLVPQPNLTSFAPITAVSAMSAEQEELGDLKLYRIPEPVTVAANSQKQVALLARPNVRIETIYRAWIVPGSGAEIRMPELAFVAHNRAAEGLGIPLPAGTLRFYDGIGERVMLVGETYLRDVAVGEEISLGTAAASGVVAEAELVRDGADSDLYLLTVTNDHSEPIRFEMWFNNADRFRPEIELERRDGRPVWAVTVPANGTATLRYEVDADRRRGR
jgi:hypothetical protein